MRRTLLVALLLGSGCTQRIDAQKLEQQIKVGTSEHDPKLWMKSVACPSGKKVGDTFTCDGVTEDGQKVTFDIIKGERWELRGKIFWAPALKDDLAKQNITDAHCPREVSVLTPGVTVTCDVTSDGVPAKMTVDVDPKRDDIHWVVK